MTTRAPHFGELIKLRRQELGWSQNDLANKAQVSPVTIQRLEQAAAKGERPKPIQSRTLLPLAAAFHRHQRLDTRDMLLLIVAAGVAGNRRDEVEQTIRRMAGEYQQLSDSLGAQGCRESEALLDELLKRQPKELFELQATATLLGQIYGYARTLDALRSIKAAFDADAARAGEQVKPPPGAVAHNSATGTRVLTPTHGHAALPQQIKRKRQG